MNPLHILAAGLASALGWPVNPKFPEEHASAVLCIPGGGDLFLHLDGSQLRLSAYLADELKDERFRPYYPNGETPVTSIKVKATTAPDRVAAEIRRRLLPGFTTYRNDHQAAKDRCEARDAAVVVAMTHAANGLGTPLEPRKRDHNWPYTVDALEVLGKAGTVRCAPGHDELTVKLTFSLKTAPQAEAILYQLAQFVVHPPAA